ncbi:tRNA dimethylallyltransferase [Striga asiatica]|uniref:tRNA dimethylallyltransferase n=1 Tax=Striga asiatica TaxID=4170 RepID=A0A5A7QP38_STRAF|nr:tRNA dimethylallyltransferase [Striga asiatica]
MSHNIQEGHRCFESKGESRGNKLRGRSSSSSSNTLKELPSIEITGALLLSEYLDFDLDLNLVLDLAEIVQLIKREDLDFDFELDLNLILDLEDRVHLFKRDPLSLTTDE